MFERFTASAANAIMLGIAEGRALGHNFVGSECILLGLIADSNGTAGAFLKKAGITLEDARQEVENILGRGMGFVQEEIPFTPRAKRIIELSFHVSHEHIDSRHLLIGLLKEDVHAPTPGVAIRVLNKLDVDTGLMLQQLYGPSGSE